MKLNGTKVHKRRDKIGPFDAFYERGSMFSDLPKGRCVRKAFDYDGMHIGIVSRDWKIKQKLLILLIPIILCAVALGYFLATNPPKAYCIIYRPTVPYRIDDNTVALNITNFSDDTLYIHVEDKSYTLNKGDTLTSVPLTSSEFILTLEYDNHFYREEVRL